MTAMVEAKIRKYDHAWPDHPDGPKYPIETQAQVMSLGRRLGRLDADEATKAKIKSSATRIANRKGFALPKSWAAEKAAKRGKESSATVSDEMIRSSLSAALRLDSDPDGDGDDETVSNMWVYCYPVDVYDDWFVYSMNGDDDDDCGLYKRSYALDANDEAVLGSDIQRVVRRVTYDPYVEQPEEGQEAERAERPPGVPIRESADFVERDTAFTVQSFEAGSQGRKGTIRGTAIKPGFNKSKQRYYPKETLAASVESLNGKKMYIDHPSTIDDRTRPERSIKDQAAIITNAWVQPDGSIGYEATIFDPWLDGRVAMMAERGVLPALATSVNYRGVAEKTTIEGLRTDRIEEMDYNSLDFVTEAGAWGDVAQTEADAPRGADDTSGIAAKEHDVAVDEKAFESLQAQIGGLVTSVQTLTERNDANEKRAIRAETRIAVKDLLGESLLPKEAQEKLAREYDGRESVDGLADRIAAEIAYIETLTGKKLEAAPAQTSVEQERQKIRGQRTAAPKRVVVGNGGDGREADTKPTPPTLESAAGWLFGDGNKAKQFGERFVS